MELQSIPFCVEAVVVAPIMDFWEFDKTKHKASVYVGPSPGVFVGVQFRDQCLERNTDADEQDLLLVLLLLFGNKKAAEVLRNLVSCLLQEDMEFRCWHLSRLFLAGRRFQLPNATAAPRWRVFRASLLRSNRLLFLPLRLHL